MLLYCPWLGDTEKCSKKWKKWFWGKLWLILWSTKQSRPAWNYFLILHVLFTRVLWWTYLFVYSIDIYHIHKLQCTEVVVVVVVKIEIKKMTGRQHKKKKRSRPVMVTVRAERKGKRSQLVMMTVRVERKEKRSRPLMLIMLMWYRYLSVLLVATHYLVKP